MRVAAEEIFGRETSSWEGNKIGSGLTRSFLQSRLPVGRVMHHSDMSTTKTEVSMLRFAIYKLDIEGIYSDATLECCLRGLP